MHSLLSVKIAYRSACGGMTRTEVLAWHCKNIAYHPPKNWEVMSFILAREVIINQPEVDFADCSLTAHRCSTQLLSWHGYAWLWYNLISVWFGVASWTAPIAESRKSGLISLIEDCNTTEVGVHVALLATGVYDVAAVAVYSAFIVSKSFHACWRHDDVGRERCSNLAPTVAAAGASDTRGLYGSR